MLERGWLTAALWILCLSASLVARADSSNPNLLPLGENEPYLGNTGIGRANDTGAVYYNPSGLAELLEDRISVSGAAYLHFQTHADTFLNVDNTNVPFNASGFATIPFLYVATRRAGDWVGALSVLVPASLSLDNSLPFETPNTRGNTIYSQSQSELWIGLSAAHKLSYRWSLGLTLYGIQHHESQTLGFDLQNKNDPSSFASSISQLNLNTFGLSAIVGLSYVPTDWLRFGLRAQSALWQLYGSGSSYQVTHLVSNGVPMTTGENVSGEAHAPIPFDFGIGFALNPWEPLTLLADASLQLGETYSTFPDSATMNQTVNLATTPRVNVGLELRFSPEWALRVGGFYNPSTGGGHPGDADYLKEDYFGFSGGIGLSDTHVRTTLGGYFAQSSGTATLGATGGATTSLSSTIVAVLLTTAYVF
jgi:hypothetical protein